MNALQRLPAQLLAVWRGLSPARRYGAIILAILTVLTVGAFAYFSASGEYRPLLTGLSPEESSTVAARLQAQSIPHKFDGGGSTVLVPEERWAAARVALAADGLPARGGKGFELFDDAPLGMTPFVQTVNYTRALQSELARSVMQLEPIAAARVIIARTDPTPFVRDQRPPTASVVLKLKPGATLHRGTAASIVALVARSVEGLKPENVAVVDSSGRQLSDPRAGEPEAALAGQIEYRRELEAHLASKAEEVLARHLGPGRAVIRVTADLNYQRVKERRETYSPEDRAVASERTVTTKSANGGGARGAAGAASAVVRAGGTTAAPSGGTSQEETAQTDYLVSKSVRELEDRMGGVQRLTIAALVDLAPPGDGAEARPIISLADAQDIIKQAVGYRTGRDEIKVTDARLAAPLPLADVAEDAAQMQKVSTYLGLARNLALAIAVAVTALALLMLARRRRPAAAPTTPPPTNGHVNGHAADPDLPPGGPVELAREERRRRELSRLVEMAEKDPDGLAELIESLLGGAARA